ncbi:hypothetical protein CQA66_03945 [Helicobacter aurati]|uniref:Indole-3-glycerol-phosphate synthase n=1 Tax=Helicobacter aurati TaxID=137778 RepID=A0A3D8J5I3_9HELI|nr:hypothetical protein [Helicobacter aurati]RDU72752.1 hypothetical protein CQA66_03945 [Helicobacter aurati]
MDYNYVIQQAIIPQLKITQFKKQEIPQDMLGRTLAYSCFLPRLSDTAYLYQNFRYTQENRLPHKALSISLQALSLLLQDSVIQQTIFDSANHEQMLCVFLENTPINYHETNDYTMIDSIGILRRLTPLFVAQSGVIIETYQVLESAIAGADMVVLDSVFLRAYALFVCLAKPHLSDLQDSYDSIHSKESILSNLLTTHTILPEHYKEHKKILEKNFNELVVTAMNLGLVPIVKIHTQEDLKLLLSLKHPIDCVITPPNFISLLPNTYLLFSHIAYSNATKEKSTQDKNYELSKFCQRYSGIDMVIESF